MARPKKIGLDYFPIDVDMAQDDKIELIEAQHGIVGFAMVIRLFMLIYKNGFYYKWTEKEQLLFSKRVNVDVKEVNVIINDCIKWGLFNNDMYENYEILTSKGIQKRYLVAVGRRQKVTIDSKYLLLNDKLLNDYKNVTIEEVNVNKNTINEDIIINSNPQSKVKKSKVKNNKDIVDFFDKVWKLYPNKKGKGQISLTTKKKIYTLGYETIKKCIDRYVDYVNANDWLQFKNGSTFFNSGYIDYLDENYQKEEPKKPVNKSGFINYDQRTYDYDKLEKKAMERMLNDN